MDHKALAKQLLTHKGNHPKFTTYRGITDYIARRFLIDQFKQFYDSYAFDWADALSFWIVSFVMLWLPVQLGIWFWIGAASTLGSQISIQNYFNGDSGALRSALRNQWYTIYRKFCNDRPVEMYMCYKLQLKDDRRYVQREQDTTDSHGDWFLQKLEQLLCDDLFTKTFDKAFELHYELRTRLAVALRLDFTYDTSKESSSPMKEVPPSEK